MKHQHLDDLHGRVQSTPFGAPGMTRRERLERWATVLERHDGPVVPLLRIEYLPEAERIQARRDGSPLAVAFADPVLRAEGLESDRLGDITSFFDLSPDEAHHLFCDCHYHGTMTSKRVASGLRRLARGSMLRVLWEGMSRMIPAFRH